MSNRDLFVRGSATSQAAAHEIRARAQSLREQVYAHIAARGAHGATDDEVQRALQLNPSTQRPRRVELLTAGRVLDAQTTRPTPSGRQAVVWRAVAVPQTPGCTRATQRFAALEAELGRLKQVARAALAEPMAGGAARSMLAWLIERP